MVLAAVPSLWRYRAWVTIWLNIPANFALSSRLSFHGAVIAEQFGHQARAGVGACDVKGMPTDPRHPWNLA